MKKMILGLLVVALATTGIVAATGPGFYGEGGHREGDFQAYHNAHDGMHNVHDGMQDVIDSGSYEDLEALREKYDRPMMPWVDSPEDFEQMQNGRGMRNCPMWQ